MQELYGDEKASSILAKYPSRKPRSYTEEQRQLTSKNNSLRVKIYKLFMVCGSEIIGTQVQLSKYFNISTDSMKFIINNGIFKNKCRGMDVKESIESIIIIGTLKDTRLNLQ
jgi:hypothetical protein